MKYTVIFHEAEEGGYWAEVPTSPGCYSQGETIEETMKSVREAIEAHIGILVEDGKKIPEEGNFVMGRLEVPVGALP